MVIVESLPLLFLSKYFDLSRSALAIKSKKLENSYHTSIYTKNLSSGNSKGIGKLVRHKCC